MARWTCPVQFIDSLAFIGLEVEYSSWCPLLVIDNFFEYALVDAIEEECYASHRI